MFCKQEGGKEGRAEREETAAEAKRKETTRSTTAMHGWPQLPLPTRPPTDIRRGG